MTRKEHARQLRQEKRAKFEERRESWVKECPSLIVTIAGGHKSLEKVTD